MNDQNLFVWSRRRAVYHLPACRWADAIAERNWREAAEPDEGLRPCKRCQPQPSKPEIADPSQGDHTP